MTEEDVPVVEIGVVGPVLAPGVVDHGVVTEIGAVTMIEEAAEIRTEKKREVKRVKKRKKGKQLRRRKGVSDVQILFRIVHNPTQNKDNVMLKTMQNSRPPSVNVHYIWKDHPDSWICCHIVVCYCIVLCRNGSRGRT